MIGIDQSGRRRLAMGVATFAVNSRGAIMKASGALAMSGVRFCVESMDKCGLVVCSPSSLPEPRNAVDLSECNNRLSAGMWDSEIKCQRLKHIFKEELAAFSST